jgi:dolichyl-phosphate beta-glucosyltransferase
MLSLLLLSLQEGWIFDIELILLAIWLSIPLREVAVHWHEIEGSKIRLATDSIRMALDLLVIRLNYWTGRWTIPSRLQENQKTDDLKLKS